MTDPMEECADQDTCLWNPQPSERWRDQVEVVSWEPSGSGHIKILDCPRCRHQMSVVDGSAVSVEAFREVIAEVDDRAIAFLLERIADDIDDNDELVTARCNCRMEHTGHPTKPEGVTWGCGQAGAISVP
ncbi:MAG: hypothetical protein WKF41_05575 [Gaiellaceae bacterium]